ncbi:MAG: type II toxin-antitoxin system mRNA interferase toxin, RelE/StbE family [Chloroflexota bacterium]
MRTLVWSSAFVRAFKRVTRRRPVLRDRIERTLRQLTEDPFHPSLRSHKLKGELAGAWACSVDYDVRILFELVQNRATGEDEILLLTLGSHSEVY